MNNLRNTLVIFMSAKVNNIIDKKKYTTFLIVFDVFKAAIEAVFMRGAI